MILNLCKVAQGGKTLFLKLTNMINSLSLHIPKKKNTLLLYKCRNKDILGSY